MSEWADKPAPESMRVRVLLLSPANRLLLFKYRDLSPSGRPQPCWATAGGGREPGESIHETAIREIAEETGISDVRLGPVVWYGEDSHRSGEWKLLYREHFIVAFAPGEEIETGGWTDHERREVMETRWWSLEELKTTDEVIYPFGLAGLLEPLLSGTYPDKIITLPPI